MSQTLIRLAAGVGVAVTVAGGLDVAVAAAEPGGPRAAANGPRDSAKSRTDPGERQDPGCGRHRREDPASQPGAIDQQPGAVAGRGTAPVAFPETPTASRPTGPVTEAGPTPEEATPAPATAPRRSSGRNSAAQAVTAMVVPRVTVGDGRTPRHLAPEPPELRPSAVAVADTVSPAAPEPVASDPARLPALWLEPVSPRAPRQAWVPDNPVTSLWGDAEAGWPAGVIFGIAGLLLAPVGGVLLGRRQAKASRSASHLIDR